jgi:hypothetical protein
MSGLDGRWRVVRESGLLPPAVTKEITGGKGWTLVAGVPVAPFRVEGTTLRYLLVPVRDELEPRCEGGWSGRGLLVGREFCRFRLERATEGSPLPV